MVQPASVGTKRACLNCGTRFYDLDQMVIVCPKCGHEHSPDSFIKMRRTRSTGNADVVKLQAAKRKADMAPMSEEGPGEDAFEEDAEESEDEEVIEDTNDLGDDDDLGEDIGRDEGMDPNER